ncbi:hypothetical protein [Micromonospora sp. NPDC047134]|uniref:hypothetical protein n=1 Tax=Micromonospora sp. NPDC047134 TaxID=3154340 RepID=UPI0033F27985
MNGPSVVHVARRTSGKAVASMVIGIIGALGVSCIFGIPSFIERCHRCYPDGWCPRVAVSRAWVLAWLRVRYLR